MVFSGEVHPFRFVTEISRKRWFLTHLNRNPVQGLHLDVLQKVKLVSV